MDYRIITFESIAGSEEHIIISREDGSCESFPADETNPRYIQFLEETA